jgi:MFS family permease
MALGDDVARGDGMGRWWMVAVLSVAGLVSYTDRVILSALVDPIRADLRISDSQVSLLQGAAFAIIYVIAGLPLGRLADRASRIRLIIAGSTLWCLGTIACGMAPGFGALFAARFVIGVGEAALAPAAISMIADRFPPERRGTAVGIFLTGMIVGGPAAVSIGGGMLAAAQRGAFASLPIVGGLAPWRTVLVTVGVAGLLIPLACLTIAEPPRTEREPQRGEMSFRDVLAGFAREKHLLIPLYLGLALLSVGDYGILSWTPTLLSRKFALDPATIGLWFGVISAAGGILGSVVGGVMSDVAERRGGARARFASVAVAAAAAAAGAALLAGGSAAMAYAGLAVWTFASALGGTGGTAALGVVVPNEMRGVSISIMAFCNTLLGLGLGPTLVALATEQVYRDPVAVGAAMTVTIVPAGVLAALAFGRSGRVVARQVRT